MDPYLVLEIIDSYNKNPQKYTDEEAEFIAGLANILQANFKKENKAISKGLFDFADTALLGALPDTLRPVSRGESVFGEATSETVGGLLGGLAGGAALGAGAVRGGRGIINRFRSSPSPLDTQPLLSGSVQYGRYGTPSPQRSNLLELTSGQRLLPSGQGLLGGQTRSQVIRNRLPLDSTSGQPIPMTSRAGEAIPMGGDLLGFLTGIRRPAPTDAGLAYREMKNLSRTNPSRSLTRKTTAPSEIREFAENMGITDMIDKGNYFDRQSLINYANKHPRTIKNPNKLTKTQKNQIIQRIKDESIDREILARDNSFTRFDLLVGPDSKTRAPKRNLLQLTSGIDNDIDIEIRRLENLADMGDYDAYEALDELYKYRDGFSGNIDYIRRFNFGRYDNIDRRPNELPF